MAIMGMGKTKPTRPPPVQGTSTGDGSDVLGAGLTGAASGAAAGGPVGAAIGALGSIAVSALSKMLGAGPELSGAEQDAARRADEDARRKAAMATQTAQTPTTKPAPSALTLTQSPLQSQEYLRMQALKRMAAPK